MGGLDSLHAWPLWLLAALPLIWMAARRHGGGLRGGVALATALRSVTLVLVVAAMMQPLLVVPVRGVSIVYALDVSHSVSPEFVHTALDWIEAADAHGRPAQARYVVFGDRARLLDRIDAARSILVTQGLAGAGSAAIGQAATNLEEALSVASSGFAPGYSRRLVLLSDGNQNEGNVWRAVARLHAQAVRVFSVPARVSVDSDAWVEAVGVPQAPRQREAVPLIVRTFSRTATHGRIQYSINGGRVREQAVSLSPGPSEWTFMVRFVRAGANTVDVRVDAAGDQARHNDTWRQTVWVGPRPRVLYLEGAAQTSRYLSWALRAQGIEVTLSSAADLERDPRALAEHDVVILSDVPSTELGSALTHRLEAFVREGGGLVFAAGENSYGKGGFANSTMEALLPVKFEELRARREIDLVLLIDRSASMRGAALEYAKTAALSALDRLDPHHRLAVLAFDSQPHEVVPLREVGDAREARDSISRMTAAGQTNIFNALLHARILLQGSRAKTRHIILLSDGNTALASGLPPEPAAPTPAQAPSAVQAPTSFAALTALLASDGITLSTVAIGVDPDAELMSLLASRTGGKSYLAGSEAEIPGMFVQEAERLLADSIIEEPFRPIVRLSTRMLAGVDFATGPELRGYVAARAKPFSEVVLEATGRRPLLVQSHYGLGKTVVFLSDVKNRWALDWLDWPGYGRAWAQIVRTASRRGAGGQLALRVGRSGQVASVTLNAAGADARYRNALEPVLRVSEPRGLQYLTRLAQSGPGEYAGRIRLEPSPLAPYVFEVVEAAGTARAQLTELGARSLFYPHTDEYRVLPPDQALLRALSASTGGTFEPRMQELFADHGERGSRSIALWQYCAGAALLAFLTDLLVRRLPWSRRSR